VRIYLDACAINRLTDDPGQMRVRLEADAVELVFRHVLDGRVVWIASSVLGTELQRNPDTRRREDALAMLPYAAEIRFPDTAISDRARH